MKGEKYKEINYLFLASFPILSLSLCQDIKNKVGKIQKMDITKEITVSPLEVGELQVSLCYNDNLERLTVTVGDTRNLKVRTLFIIAGDTGNICIHLYIKCTKLL